LGYNYVRFLNDKSPAASKLREKIKALEAVDKDAKKV